VFSGATSALLAGALAAPFPGAPAAQRYTDFGRCPRAPANAYLPRDAGCVDVARADVDGDGRVDLVLLYARLDAHGTARSHVLAAVRASGGRLSVRTGRYALQGQRLLVLRDLDGRPGAEAIVHEAHSTTAEQIGVYSFAGGALRRSGELSVDGEDAGLRFGVRCRAGEVLQSEFDERLPLRGVWDRTQTTYRWVAGRLVPDGARKVRARPTAARVGLHC
jgi:hypothetical protein